MSKSNEMLSTDLLRKMDAYSRAANRRRRIGMRTLKSRQ
jgi:hypothetical protein